MGLFVTTLLKNHESLKDLKNNYVNKKIDWKIPFDHENFSSVLQAAFLYQ